MVIDHDRLYIIDRGLQRPWSGQCLLVKESWTTCPLICVSKRDVTGRNVSERISSVTGEVPLNICDLILAIASFCAVNPQGHPVVEVTVHAALWRKPPIHRLRDETRINRLWSEIRIDWDAEIRINLSASRSWHTLKLKDDSISDKRFSIQRQFYRNRTKEIYLRNSKLHHQKKLRSMFYYAPTVVRRGSCFW